MFVYLSFSTKQLVINSELSTIKIRILDSEVVPVALSPSETTAETKKAATYNYCHAQANTISYPYANNETMSLAGIDYHTLKPWPDRAQRSQHRGLALRMEIHQTEGKQESETIRIRISPCVCNQAQSIIIITA